MIQTVEAVVDAAGGVRLLDPVSVAGPRRALVTVLDEPPATGPGELPAPLEPGRVYEVWSPHSDYAAAATLQAALDEPARQP